MQLCGYQINLASKTNRGQSEGRGYGMEAIYSDSDQDYDSEEKESRTPAVSENNV